MSTGIDEAMEAAKEAMQDQRPLNATQGRNLQKIVKNDFERLRSELNLYRQEEMVRREKEIRESFRISPEAKEALEADINALNAEYRNRAEALKARARAMGLMISNGLAPAHSHVTFSEEKVLAEIQRMQNEVRQEVAIALQTAETKFYEAERMVLLATITGQAERILAGIPTSQQLVAEAYEQRERRKELTTGNTQQ